MIWQNPWALAGLIALGVPILIHLLSRQKARVEQFPTLRFLPDVQSAPVQRTRITDPLLLAIRLLIVALAVAALAQPLMMTANRRASAERTVARAIIVDTSASMQRRSAAVTAMDTARAAATALNASAATALIIQTASPSSVMRAASSWLTAQGGRRELVVVSDFQQGTLDSLDVVGIDDGVTVHFERIGIADTAMVRAGAPARTIALLTAPQSRAAAEAARVAARVRGTDTSTAQIAIVYPDAPDRARLLSEAKAISSASLADAVVEIRRNPLASTAMSISPVVSNAVSSLVRVSGGSPSQSVVYGGEGSIYGHDALLLFPSFDEATVASAALISAADKALNPEPSPPELDPSFIDDATLRSWEHLNGQHARATPATTGESDGRWFWLAALLLLGAETFVRRRTATPEVANAAG